MEPIPDPLSLCVYFWCFVRNSFRGEMYGDRRDKVCDGGMEFRAGRGVWGRRPSCAICDVTPRWNSTTDICSMSLVVGGSSGEEGFPITGSADCVFPGGASWLLYLRPAVVRTVGLRIGAIFYVRFLRDSPCAVFGWGT